MRIMAAAGLLLAASAGAADWDWGGGGETLTTLGLVPDFNFDQRDRLALWLGAKPVPWLTFSFGGSYAFSYNTAATPPVRPYLFDVDYLKTELRLGPRVQAVAGRSAFSDFTGHVMAHTLDGMRFQVALPFMVLNAGIGFSGLMLKPVSTVIMTNTDSAEQTMPEVFFAAPRLIETVGVVFPQLFARQDLTISFLAQQDLRPGAKLIPEGTTEASPAGLYGGRLDTYYAGVGLGGPIVPALYYDAFFYFETGTTLSYGDFSQSGSSSWKYQPIVAFLGGLGVRYFFEGRLSSRAEIRGVFSSGDPDNSTFLEGNTAGYSMMFVPISQEELSLVFAPRLGNLLLLEASYSLKPHESLQTLLKALVFIRPGAGAISEGGLAAAAGAAYLGAEIDVVLNFRPFSDLGLSLSVGGFLPSPEFTGAAAQPRFKGRIETSVSF